MPRSEDFCMICGEQNCRCNKVPKKAVPKKLPTKAAKPVPSTPTRVAPTRKVGVSRVGPSDVGKRPVATGTTARSSPANVTRVRDSELEALSNAVTVLADADMLHRDELVKHRSIIKLPSHRVDAMIWKQDNREANERNELRRER